MNCKNIIKSSKYNLLYYAAYKILLDILYIYCVSPTYSYMGLTLDINFVKIIASNFFLLLISLFISKSNQKVSHMIIQLHFIIMIIPILSLYPLANLSTRFMLMIIICFLLQIALIKLLPQVKIKKIKHGKYILYPLIGILSLVTFTYLLITQPINIKALSFSDIYSIRAEQSINHNIMKYLIVWQYRIINPFIIVICYLKKRYVRMVAIIFLQLILYLMYPHKEVVLAIGLLLIVLFALERKFNFNKIFILVFSLLNLLGAALYSLIDYLMLFAIFPVRMLNLPAKIKFEHYDFFSVNDKLFYSEGMIGKLLGLDYPYSVASGVLINPRGGNSNTGYIAYAYDNSGFIGMILMSIVFVIVIKIIDSISVGENKGIIFSLFVYPMIILNDGDLLTMLLTGGVLLLIFIIFLYKNIDGREEKVDEKENNS